MTPCFGCLSISVMIAAARDVVVSLSRVWLCFASGGLALLLSVTAGCGKPFNVKTQPTLPSPRETAKAALDNIAIEVYSISDEDFLYDTFDANLISAGVLPVRVKVTNSGNETLELKNAKFELEIQSRRTRSADARKSFKRLISYYGISVYSKSGYNESLEAFSSYALDVIKPLSSGESREGLLFFLLTEEAARSSGATLIIGKLKPKPLNDRVISLKLN